ncbi:hypothetical protein B0T14DRAFT_489878 [Immersiella caudata]|uniref:DUF7730 domain-containing protein n=1 Tax=Immersiella caudata TaxID=314043 RepID=A0AA39XCA5_9PEZI|nr:hypothetical protein B0T14DRAFT_489878 [Immersiella caudata]
MPIPFLFLPGEIRNPIYHHLLTSPTHIELCLCTGRLRRTAPKFPLDRRWSHSDSEDDNSTDCLCHHYLSTNPNHSTNINTNSKTSPPPSSNPGPHAAILLTSRQIHTEASHLLYATNAFTIFTSKTSTLSAFLHSIGRQNAHLIRHMCIPFLHVRLRLDLEDPWSSDDEEEMNGPLNVRGYEGVKCDPLFRVANPGVLDMLGKWCTGLEELEAVVGTAQRADRNVVRRGLVREAIEFLDGEARRRIKSMRRFVVNVYEQDGVDRQWIEAMLGCRGFFWRLAPHHSGFRA